MQGKPRNWARFVGNRARLLIGRAVIGVVLLVDYMLAAGGSQAIANMEPARIEGRELVYGHRAPPQRRHGQVSGHIDGSSTVADSIKRHATNNQTVGGKHGSQKRDSS
jgi:hypothetical protein